MPQAAPGARPLPSLKPALVVVAVALSIVIFGAVIALVGTPSAQPAGSPVTSHVEKLAGSGLPAVPARSVLSHIASAGEPPADIVSSLYVPAGSRYLSKRVESRGVSQFDSSISLSVPAPEAKVRSFFLKVLSHGQWTTNSISSPHKGASELIAERAGSDGYQWRIGITASGEHTLVAPALAGEATSPARTRVSIQLYQVEDAS